MQQPTHGTRRDAIAKIKAATAFTALPLAFMALGLAGQVGNLQPGCEADFVVINPACTPLLERKTRQAESLDELLFAMIILGDDRLIERTVVSQAK